ncbi:MAG: rhamnulokinase [Clostridiales bacterium]|nr:rhamnulokinase [Clostridiales bacterium]OPZ68404.1 MAG: Rhamnulokinase [Firmicutes bacterium ADurb.Bin467]
MRYLAFDLGASSGKMALGEFDGRRLSVRPVHGFKNGIVRMGDGLYWDFPGIWANFLEGLSKACREAEIRSVGVDGFNNDFSFVDARGELLMPVRCYRDPRTLRHERAIYARIPPRELYMHTGNQLAPFNTYMQLAAMVENGQRFFFEHAENLLMLPDLLVFFLTGSRATEYTLAAETQMLDLNTKKWIPEILDAIGFPERLFAPLAMPGTVAGSIAPRVRAENGIGPIDCVSVCEHDTASAFLAAPAGPDSAILSSGTWALVGTEADAPVISEYGYRHNIANEGGFPGHHRILKNVMGGWILQQLQRDFALEGKVFDYGRIEALALAAEPFLCAIDVDDPRFFAPGEMRKTVREAALNAGERAPETPGEFFRTAYEALAFKYRDALETLERLLARHFRRLHVVGGGARDAVACQFAANAIGRPVLAGPADGTAIGNILVQMIASGAISSVEQGRQIVRESAMLREYEPRDVAIWEERYQAFREKYSADKAAD